MDNPFVFNVGEKKEEEKLPDIFDVIIIGGGPAGLTAGIYASRAGLKTLLLEKISIGGQIYVTDVIENYPGIEKITGPELINIMEKQAKTFGTYFKIEEVIEIKDDGNLKIVKTASGNLYKAYSIIIAIGAKYRNLNVKGEEKFRGRGVSNCATCDGAFYKNMDVAVIGGGDTAIEEGLFLTKFAKTVYIIHRRDKLRATKILQDRAFKNEKIKFIFDSVVEEIIGDTGVEKLKIKNVKTDEISELKVKGVFVFIGLIPNTDFLKGYIDLTDNGYIKVDKNMKTSKDGVYACGDCIDKSLRQVVTACGDGATAAFSVQHYIENIKEK